MFSDAYTFTRREEGGFVNDPDDSGGATLGGVTQGTYKEWRKSKNLPPQDVSLLTPKEHEEIFREIWTRNKCGLLPRGLDLMHFDAAVHHGDKQAALFLQRTLQVSPDGIIGPQTLKALDFANKYTITFLAQRRREFMIRLARNRPKDKKFLKGWLSRVDRCEKKALSLFLGS